MELTEAFATGFADIALGHVTRKFPHKLDHVLTGPGEEVDPERLHPIFYGSFDWHSCVHGYWTLARVLRRFPSGPVAGAIRPLFDAKFSEDLVARECAYFRQPAARAFERPYGWAWLLKLAAELQTFRAEPWADTLAPLAQLIVGRLSAFLPLATYPTRSGSHGNTAFALALASDFARSADDRDLTAFLRGTAQRWYGDDADCQAWEPSGDDFLSAALVEAECMRRLLAPADFLPWFDRFLPRLREGRPASLFTPAVATDRTDGKLAHLDGFNLSRAWCLRSLAGAMIEGDARRPILIDAAATHLGGSLPFLDIHYMGGHWLASFALLALDE